MLDRSAAMTTRLLSQYRILQLGAELFGGDGGIRTLDTLFKVCSFSKRVPSAARPRLHRPDMPHAMTHRKSLSAFIVSSIDWFFVCKALSLYNVVR